MVRTAYRVDFPEGSFSEVEQEAERLGVDLGDLLAVAAAIVIRVLADATHEVRRAARPASPGDP